MNEITCCDTHCGDSNINIETSYDDPYKMMWTRTDVDAGSIENLQYNLDHREGGMLLSSGKVGLLSSFDMIDVQKMFITTQLQYNNGSYTSNTIEPFHVNSIKVFNTDESCSRVQTLKQSMNIRSAILSSTYNVVDRLTQQNVEVDVDLYTPRNIPYSVMQTITVRRSDPNLEKVMLYHECYSKSSSLRDISFNSNTIYHTRPNGEDVPVYILSGRGYTNKGKEVAFASTYVMVPSPSSPSSSSQVLNMGFNVYRDDPSKSFNTFKVHFGDQEEQGQNEVTFHIFSSIMSDFDFEYPLDEVKKLVLSMYLGSTSPLAAMQKVRSDHVFTWSKMWQTSLCITPKCGIPEELENRVKTLNRHIKVSLYNLMAASRESQTFDVTSTAVSILDVDGTIMNDGDLWLVPFMNIFKPRIAKNMLDVRHNTMNIAQQIAGSYGLNGVKYPYNDSISKLSDGLQWNVINPISVFNTALIAINVWNYYRATKDKDWLQTIGFPILKNVAEFVVSVAEKKKEDEDTNENVNNSVNMSSEIYVIKNVISLNGIESEVDNSFTNNKCKLALRYAIEASYDLSYFVKQEWLDVFFGLRIQYIDGCKRIIKFDAQSNPDEDLYFILEMLFILLPTYNTLYYQENERTVVKQKSEAIKENIDFYIDRVKTKFTSHPYNLAVLTILYGMYAQFDEKFVAEFEEYLQKFTDTYVKGIWNNMTQFGSCKRANALNMNAIFLMILMLATFQARLAGSVSSTQFYSEEFGLCLKRNANMPSFWMDIRATSIGAEKKDHCARNNTLFIASSQP